MRLFIRTIALILLCSCAGTTNLIQPSEQWYIAPDGESVIIYSEPKRSDNYFSLEIHERYKIAEAQKGFYRIMTITGEEYYISPKQVKPLAYNPVIHPSAETLDKIDVERINCRDYSSQFDAQLAFNADRVGLSDLDADGDGTPCEQLSRWRKSNTSGYSSKKSNSSTSTGDVHVEGHYRKTKSGKTVYVKPHTRKHPRR